MAVDGRPDVPGPPGRLVGRGEGEVGQRLADPAAFEQDETEAESSPRVDTDEVVLQCRAIRAHQDALGLVQAPGVEPGEGVRLLHGVRLDQAALVFGGVSAQILVQPQGIVGTAQPGQGTGRDQGGLRVTGAPGQHSTVRACSRATMKRHRNAAARARYPERSVPVSCRAFSSARSCRPAKR